MGPNWRYVVEDEGCEGETHGALTQDAFARVRVFLGVRSGVGRHEIAGPQIARQFFLPSVSWAIPINIEHDVPEFMKKGECDG